MKANKNLLKEAGERVLLTGNEAVARGCLEAGVVVATAFPGTPASQILDNLGAVAPKVGFHAEHSVNEAVAFEVAAGAAIAGVRSVMATKMLGVNLLSDPLIVIAITGVNGGLVVVTADDPQQHSSQNAEDTRFFGMLAKVPFLEPVDGQETKDLTKYAFELSEQLQLPVFIRITSRICHSYFDVLLGEMQPPKKEGKFEKDPKRYVMISSYSRPRQSILIKKIEEAAKIHSSNPWNKIVEFTNGRGAVPSSDNPSNTFGIIASGLTFPYVEEVLEETKINARVLKLATTYPLPGELMERFLQGLDEVLIIEEGDPVTEMLTRAFVQHKGYKLKILGKDDGLLPKKGELNPDLIGDVLEKLFKTKFRKELTEPYKKAEALVNRRIPALCAGCPHRASYYALKEALKRLKKEGAILGDRGCYNQGVYEPIAGIDTCICMGASIAMASGVYLSGSKEPAIAVIGDGTFLHTGIPSLLNAVHNNSNITVLIMDNSITAMTGHQPNPGTGRNLMGEKTADIDIRRIVEALGVKDIQVVNAYNSELLIDTVMRMIENPGPSVVISRAPCAVVVGREIRSKKKEKSPQAIVNLDKCTGCKICMKKIGCPAFDWSEDEKPHLVILPNCTGCGLCVNICPKEAILIPKKPRRALEISPKTAVVKEK